jgi:hypothetical protein
MKKPIWYLDAFLGLMGLARRRRREEFFEVAVPAAALLGIGIAVGTGVGLMLAPSSGRRLRQDFGDRLDQIKNRVSGEARRRGVLNATPSQQQ